MLNATTGNSGEGVAETVAHVRVSHEEPGVKQLLEVADHAHIHQGSHIIGLHIAANDLYQMSFMANSHACCQPGLQRLATALGMHITLLWDSFSPSTQLDVSTLRRVNSENVRGTTTYKGYLPLISNLSACSLCEIPTVRTQAGCIMFKS